MSKIIINKKIVLMLAITLILFSFYSAIARADYFDNPVSFTNPQYINDSDDSTYAVKVGGIAAPLGINFTEMRYVGFVDYKVMITVQDSNGDLILKSTDGTNGWVTEYTICSHPNCQPTGTTIWSGHYALNKNVKGLAIYFDNPNTEERLYNLNWTYPAGYITTSVNYTSPVIPGEAQTIYFNITNNSITTPSLTQANATLNFYNGSSYQMNNIFMNDTSAGFSYTFNTPILSSNALASFNISYFANNVPFNSSNYQQVIYTIPALNITNYACNPGTYTAYNFTIFDEDNSTLLTADVDYNFAYGITNNTLQRTQGHLSAISSLYICVNSTVSSTYYMGYGSVFYQKTGWVARRYYVFSNASITSYTNNVSLYDLNNAYATAFQLLITDTSGNGYSNYYVAMLRYYPSLNSYNVVDIGLTDDTGSTVTYARAQDIDYRIGVYYLNGTLVKLANPVRMVCISSPCSYNLRIPRTLLDYYSYLSIQQSLTYNYTTGIWSYVYSDSSQRTSSMNLTIYKDAGDSSNIVCNAFTSGFVGAMTCNTSLYSGTLRGEVTRGTNPDVLITQLIIETARTVFSSSTWVLWLAALAAIPIIMLFAIVSPYAALIGGVIALLPGLIFKIIPAAVLGATIILFAIIAHFIGRRQ